MPIILLYLSLSFLDQARSYPSLRIQIKCSPCEDYLVYQEIRHQKKKKKGVICQLDWVTVAPRIWVNTILRVSVRVFLHEIHI